MISPPTASRLKIAMPYRLRTLLIVLSLVAIAWFAYREHWRIMRPGSWFKAQPRIIPRTEQRQLPEP